MTMPRDRGYGNKEEEKRIELKDVYKIPAAVVAKAGLAQDRAG